MQDNFFPSANDRAEAARLLRLRTDLLALRPSRIVDGKEWDTVIGSLAEIALILLGGVGTGTYSVPEPTEKAADE